jgi:ribonuclease HI
MASRLEYFCTNNQAEYEALLFSLEILESMSVKHVEAFGDSLLVVHQVSGKYQCLDGSLNAYLDKCVDVIAILDEFSIRHIYRDENSKSNDLAQRASGYNVSNKNFSITKKPMCAYVQNMESLSILGTETGLIGSSDGLTDVPGAQIGLMNPPTGLTSPSVPDSPILENLAPDGLKHDKADIVDWRRPIIDYLQDPSHKIDRKFQRFAFKFTLVDGELYCQTSDDLLLKCLDSDQAKVAMGDHE